MKRTHYTLDRSSPAATVAVLIMALSAVLRLLYYSLGDFSIPYLLLHAVLPVTASCLFIAAILLADHADGKTWRILAIAAVACGIVFFVLKAWFDFTPLHRNLCTLLYATVLTLYTLTLSGIIPTKNLLYPLFGLPFLFHVFVEDTRDYFFADPPVPVWDWLPEMSVLCIMAALFTETFAIRTRERGGKDQ